MSACRTIRIITGTIALAGALTAASGLEFGALLYKAGMLILIVAATGFLARLVRVSADVLETIRQAGYDDGYADGLDVASPTIRRLSAVGDGTTGRSAAQ